MSIMSLTPTYTPEQLRAASDDELRMYSDSMSKENAALRWMVAMILDDAEVQYLLGEADHKYEQWWRYRIRMRLEQIAHESVMLCVEQDRRRNALHSKGGQA